MVAEELDLAEAGWGSDSKQHLFYLSQDNLSKKRKKIYG